MKADSSSRHAGAIPLHGLVLSGGRGTRLGRDKGTLDYHGVPQALWGLRLLEPFCSRRFVSVRPDQVDAPAFRGLPAVVDRGASAGPASGVAAALAEFPNVAWLVIAADMPLLTNAVIGRLVRHRDPSVLATAYRHSDGVPEPLCAIWEPSAAARLGSPAPGQGVSLRRLLEDGPTRLIDVGDNEALTSVNTEADDLRVRARLLM